MSLTIGRASITTDPSVLDCDGDRLSVAGWFTGSDLNHAKALRQQLLGLADNPDEPVIPFTSTVDTALDGFYRVASSRVTPVLGVSYEKFRFQYAVDLERVGGGFAQPAIELFYVNGPKDTNFNWASTTLALAHVFVPSSYTERSDAGSASGRTAADSSTFVYYETTYTDGAAPATEALMLSAAPGDYYDGCVAVEYTPDAGSTYYSVVGQQVTAGFASTWRLNNGLTRVSMSSTTLVVETYDGASWRSKSYTLTASAGSVTLTAPNSARILANRPEWCSVSLSGVLSTGATYTLVLSLERGQRNVEVYVSAWTSYGWKIVRSSAEAGTVIQDASAATFAIRATSNDANGDRYVIACPYTVTADTTNGGLTQGTPSSGSTKPDGTSYRASFVVGYAVDGSSATAPNDTDTLALAAVGFVSQRQRVVLR